MSKELEQILEKVALLYSRYGIKSVTMDDVARELGISKKTLYQFVSDKTDLVRQVVEHTRVCNFHTLAEQAEKGNAIEELLAVSQHLNEIMKDYSPSYEYDLRKYYPDIFKSLMEKRRKGMYEAMLDNLQRGKKEGLYREDIDEEIITKLQLSRMEALQTSEIFEPEEMHNPKFFSEIFKYHLHGVATQKGLRIMEQHKEKFEQLLV